MKCLYLPYAIYANKRGSRLWESTFLMDLIKYRSLLDEVSIATEGYDDRRVWRGLWLLYGLLLAPISLDHLQLIGRGMVMEFKIDLAIDNFGLEAGVAKRYCGLYCNICNEVL